MRILYHISAIIAVISIILGIVSKLFFFYKPLFGISALGYLRFTDTMLLFTIAFMIYEYLKGKSG